MKPKFKTTIIPFTFYRYGNYFFARVKMGVEELAIEMCVEGVERYFDVRKKNFKLKVSTRPSKNSVRMIFESRDYLRSLYFGLDEVEESVYGARRFLEYCLGVERERDFRFVFYISIVE